MHLHLKHLNDAHKAILKSAFTSAQIYTEEDLIVYLV